MEKLKNVLISVFCIACFIGVIGLFMAWDDGLLDGTMLGGMLTMILPVLIPGVVVGYSMVVVASFWANKLDKDIPVLPLGLLAFVVAGCMVVLELPDTVYVVAAIAWVAVVLISLVVFLIGKGKE